jgi:hypothetical protein
MPVGVTLALFAAILLGRTRAILGVGNAICALQRNVVVALLAAINACKAYGSAC